jgi:hypothetical protein
MKHLSADGQALAVLQVSESAVKELEHVKNGLT